MGNSAYEARRIAEEGATQKRAEREAEAAEFATVAMSSIRAFFEGRANIVVKSVTPELVIGFKRNP